MKSRAKVLLFLISLGFVSLFVDINEHEYLVKLRDTSSYHAINNNPVIAVQGLTSEPPQESDGNEINSNTANNISIYISNEYERLEGNTNIHIDADYQDHEGVAPETTSVPNVDTTTSTVANTVAMKTPLAKGVKVIPLANNQNAVLANDTRKIVYLHVGKTGGTNLEKVLRSSCEYYKRKAKIDKCLSAGINLNEESMVSNLTALTVHENIRPNLVKAFISQNNVTSFLFTLRNPIDRALSAFDMRNPANEGTSKNEPKRSLLREFYVDCFPTMQDLADILSRKKRAEYTNLKNEVADCFKLGSWTITGRGHFLVNDHLVVNYDEYAKVSTKAFPVKEIFAIRTEKFWHDVEILEHALGGKKRAFQHLQNYSFTHGSHEYVSKSRLDEEGKVSICCFLSDENEIYEDLMRRAVNIQEEEKIESLHKLYNDCGIKTNTTEAWTNQSFPWMKWKENGCV